MIVGQLSQAEFAKRMAQTKKARAEERNHDAAKRFMTVTPLTVFIADLRDALRAEREQATKKALQRREKNGRWISREAQAEAIATADKLEKLGY